jgi:hypothetical protein
MEQPRNPSATKAGPGRRHKQGHQKASPIKSRGAPVGFVQHTNKPKNTRRAEFARMGRRQALKFKKALTRQIKERLAAAEAA